MLVTLITVVYNGEEHLEQTIKSVLNQTYVNTEYIIVDGGSTDRTIEIIKNYESQISTWISEPDKGLYDAMNKGVDLANGELIAMINSDDWYERNAVHSMVQAYKENPGYSIYHSDIFIINQNGKKTLRKYNKSTFKFKYYGMTYHHPTMFITAKEYRLHRYNTNLSIYSDYQLVLETFFRSSKSFFYVEIPTVNYRIGGISAKTSIYKRIQESFLVRRNVGMNYLEILFALFLELSVYVIYKLKIWN
ncbi:glycosyltransferase family 2 protein [Ulvibacterium marinum]|uniref:Glycosyltransferase n=1 Tax=Ulvibacterium marinum TaxID=2419782 RepID=A0A3B0C6C5_9FLAO|nr:glycosyltransferase family 2 protein [Ulvibacterium marinum]RKN79764.1 glycosyltransferase [Ulvibacterium marinum]